MTSPRCPRCSSEHVTRHMEPLPATGEADLWSPVRDEAYLCSNCGLQEACLNTAKARYVEFRNRWKDPIERMSAAEHQARIDKANRDELDDARAWTWPVETLYGVFDRAWRAERLSTRSVENMYTSISVRDGEVIYENVKQIPINETLLTEVLAVPNDDVPRANYATWLRTQSHPMAIDAADFIDGQLRLARSFRLNPRADIKAELPEHAFARRTVEATDAPDRQWWRFAKDTDVMGTMPDRTAILRELGLVDNQLYFRGFVEHVAIKASRFLEIADELYSLAPIRQLTITYCKGIDHADSALLKALLESPHLDRIHALRLPVRKFGRDKGDVTVLNALTDADIEMLAASQHLRQLAYLDLEDQKRLTIAAFEALAASISLPQLSAVRHDINRYLYPGTFSFGTVGKQTRTLADRPLAGYAKELERRHGRIPWLHVAEHYGTETPDVEAVVEHPITARSQR